MDWPAGLVGALYRPGFVGGPVRKSSPTVLHELQKLDDRPKAWARREANGRHPSALMREYEIVENIKGQRFR